MPFDRPTLSEIVDRIRTDIANALNLGTSVLRRSNIGVVSKAYGGAVHMLHGHLDYLSKQILIDTASTEYLERHASVWGLSRKAATFAEGDITFTGTDGSVIPAGTIVQRADGVQFETLDEATIVSSSATATVRSLTLGVDGNTDAGVSLVLSSTISGVVATATVGVDGISGGVEAESDDDLRDRLLSRIQDPPRGGALTDYEQWATSVEGVTRAFIFPLYTGPGTVAVFVVDDSNISDPIPGTTVVEAVQAYIDERRPVTATVTVYAPVAAPMNPTIQISPNTATVRAAIEDELRSLFQREGAVGGTILRSHISEAISNASGETDHAIVSPAGNFSVPNGSFPVLGTVTFEDLT